MKKKLTVVGLLFFLLALSSLAFASDFPSKLMEFTVVVEPWAEINLPDTAQLLISEGGGTGSVTVNGNITTNFPWKIHILTFQASKNENINAWFWYEFHVNNKFIFGCNPGYGVGYRHDPGVNELEITLAVGPDLGVTPPGHEPVERFWYELLAGTYRSKVQITVEAR